uniref:Uncharacterized protein n=1 Tax=Syphacia muris TaxID=451379 RepID=A0A0N5AVG4_9BILA
MVSEQKAVGEYDCKCREAIHRCNDIWTETRSCSSWGSRSGSRCDVFTVHDCVSRMKYWTDSCNADTGRNASGV